MSIKIESTTDSETDVKAAIGNQHRLIAKPSKETIVTEEPPADDKSEKAAASGTADGEAKAEPGKDEGKSKNLDKRFSKLTRQRKEAEMRAEDADRRASYWENEAKRYRETPQPKPGEAEKVEIKQASDSEPDKAKFETQEEYLKAWTKWDRAQADKQAKIEANKAETKSHAEKLWKDYSEKETAFRKDHPDFMERVDKVKEAGIKMSPIVEDRIIRSGGPELAYELMKDVDEFKALCAMSAEDALEHIGIIRAQLKAASEKPNEVKKVAEVKPQPKPVSPVGSKVTVIKDPSKMSLKEFDAWRRAGNSSWNEP